MAIYPTYQHVLQSELVLLNLSCCLLEEQRLDLREGKGWKRNFMEMSIPPKALWSCDSGPSRTWLFRAILGVTVSTLFPQTLSWLWLLIWSPIGFSLSSWTVTVFAKPVWAGSERLGPPQRAWRLCHCPINDTEYLPSGGFSQIIPFPLLTFHRTKSKASQQWQYTREPFGIQVHQIRGKIGTTARSALQILRDLGPKHLYHIE